METILGPLRYTMLLSGNALRLAYSHHSANCGPRLFSLSPLHGDKDDQCGKTREESVDFKAVGLIGM